MKMLSDRRLRMIVEKVRGGDGRLQMKTKLKEYGNLITFNSQGTRVRMRAEFRLELHPAAGPENYKVVAVARGSTADRGAEVAKVFTDIDFTGDPAENAKLAAVQVHEGITEGHDDYGTLITGGRTATFAVNRERVLTAVVELLEQSQFMFKGKAVMFLEINTSEKVVYGDFTEPGQLVQAPIY